MEGKINTVRFCKVISVEDDTDADRIKVRLSPEDNAKTIDEICVIGHSLAGVDRTYFNRIDNMTMRRLTWKVYYYRPEEKDRLRNNLIDAGVDSDRIEMVPSSEFYDL